MQRSLFTSFCLSIIMMGCSLERNKGTQQPASKVEHQLQDRLQSFPVAGSKIDYPTLYCENVAAIKFRADITEELDVFCKDRKPTETFLNFRSAALANGPDRSLFQILDEKIDAEQEMSEIRAVLLFHIAVHPFKIKSLPIYQYITTPFKSAEMELISENSPRRDDPLDSGLHLWSVDNQVTLKMNATNKIILNNIRKTQYNLYQVLSGSEEMGLVVEHLREADQENFQKYNMLMIAFNDGSGYNNDVGGTVVIGYLNMKMNNQSYPAVGRRTVIEVQENAAKNFINGVKGGSQ